jgi:HlyD family secretion protein
MTVHVTATGITEPINEVSVGIEVSGTVAEVLVEHNDLVEAGQVLARLDATMLSAKLAQSIASLNVARAALKEAEATLRQRESEYSRLLGLNESRDGALVSEQDLTSARASRDRAVALVESSEAQIAQAQAQVMLNRTELSRTEVFSPVRGVVLSRSVEPGQTVAASLQTPELFVIAEDLTKMQLSVSRTEVFSPVRGVVLSRSVEPGQTVAASLQTPELFVIAEDLTKMQLSVDIDEADVGNIREGQRALFSVDAYPHDEFSAQVSQLRLAPHSSAGVVTYEAILAVENADLRLFPGMTATAVVTVRDVQDALLVPNAAFRFSPTVPQEVAAGNRSIVGALIPRPPAASSTSPQAPQTGRTRKVWVLDSSGGLREVAVEIGATDGAWTEILEGELRVGDAVITEELDQ